MSSHEKGLIWLAGPESEIVEVSGWLEDIGFEVALAAEAPDLNPLDGQWADCAVVLQAEQSPDETLREIDRARGLPGIPPIIVLGDPESLTQRLEDRIDIVFLESSTSQEHFLSSFCEGLTRVISNSKRLSALPFETIFREAPQAMVLVDNDGQIIFANRAFERLSGRANERVALPFLDTIDGLEQTHVLKWPRTAADRNRGRIKTSLIRADGSRVPVRLIISDFRWNEELYSQILVTNIEDEIRLEEQLTLSVFYDRLTMLANRTLLFERAERSLQNASLENPVGLLLVDLSRFRHINESLGQTVGDQLLVAVAKRLRDVVTGTDTIARIGSDDFAILRTVNSHEPDMTKLGEDLRQVISRPFIIGDEKLHINASFGIAVVTEPPFPDDPKANAYELIRTAQIALYRSKSRQRSSDSVVVFDDSMRSAVDDHHRLMADLPDAIEKGELFLHFQPIIRLPSLELAGFEALVRWIHPQLGFVPPTHFIPIAEENGSIVNLGRFVLERATQTMTGWLKEGLIPTSSSVSVNVSTMQLNDGRLLDIAKQATHSGTALRPHNLNLEITETALMENPEASLQVFKHLTKLGIGLHVDDFGTGYSSFSYLTQMPINALKVDRSFIARMQQNPKEFEIVRLVINLTKTLGIEAIAEGVEDESVLKSLCNLNCACAQGYYFARPSPAADIPNVLNRLKQLSAGR